MPQTLKSGGVTVTYNVLGNTLTVSAGVTPVFTFSLTAAGLYSFTLLKALDHAAGNDENDIPLNLGSLLQAVCKANNVDCAIAQLRPNQMDETGFIEDIGTISSTIKNATVGLAVQKSGRTSGHTTGTVSSINTRVSIRYQPVCGRGGGTSRTT